MFLVKVFALRSSGNELPGQKKGAGTWKATLCPVV